MSNGLGLEDEIARSRARVEAADDELLKDYHPARVAEMRGIPYVPPTPEQEEALARRGEKFRREVAEAKVEETEDSMREPDSWRWDTEAVTAFTDHLFEKPSKGANRNLGMLIEKKLTERRADELIRAAEMGNQDLVLVSEADIMARPAPEWWVPGLVQKGTVCVFAGEAGLGKTFLMIDLARSIATRTPFHGVQVSKGTVLYVAAEGASAFGARARAWDAYHGTSPAPGSINYIEAGVLLSDPASVKRLEDLLDTLQPDLIILDTLSQLGGVDNENDAAQLAKVFRVAKQLRDHKDGSTVILVHHVNKGAGGVRGSSVIRSNADTVIVAKKSNGGQFLLSTHIEADGKQKDGAPIKWDGFHLVDSGDSAVVALATAATDDDLLDLRALYEDGLPHTKQEAMHHAGHPKADGSNPAYKSWDRKWKGWSVGAGAILVPVDGTKQYEMLELAK